VSLAREGERILGQAEKRVELLLSRKDGDVLEPFDVGGGTTEKTDEQ
jgi:exonuclease VII small subunit